MTTRVALVDDHELVRDGLRALFAKDRAFEVVGEAETARQAIEVMAACQPEVVVMDVALPDLSGVEATRQVLAHAPGVKVVALSVHADQQYVAGMLQAGASAYVLKEEAAVELLKAIRAALAGRTYLSPELAGVVYDHVQSLAGQAELTMREREVVRLISEGRTTREIAEALNVSENTVHTHRQRIMQKLDRHSIAELTKYAIRTGLTSLLSPRRPTASRLATFRSLQGPPPALPKSPDQVTEDSPDRVTKNHPIRRYRTRCLLRLLGSAPLLPPSEKGGVGGGSVYSPLTQRGETIVRNLWTKKVTLILAPIALVVGLVVEEGCSRGDSVGDSVVRVQGPASKPVAEGFQASRDVNYDPLDGMSKEERKTAIGSQESALEFFKVIARGLAQAMKDPRSREILRAAVPKWEIGEVELAQIAIEYPELLRSVAVDLREAVAAKSMSNSLASTIVGSSSDEKALLQVAEALFDLEVVLVTPPGKEWDASDGIPVFYDPIDSDASLIEGFGPDLGRVTLAEDITEAPYPFLAINFNEDSPQDESQASYQSPGQPADPLNRLWNFSLISSAYAHSPSSHSSCYHNNLLYPAWEITIYKDHDPGYWNKPEVHVRLDWVSAEVQHDDHSLKKVDKVNKKYTYRNRYAKHGACSTRLDVEVYEWDPISNDDMAKWYNRWVPITLEDPDEVKITVGRSSRNK